MAELVYSLTYKRTGYEDKYDSRNKYNCVAGGCDD
jgi:hypothetical protein